MAEKQEEQVPNYPALARAVLVDARHGSRTEIARTLASRQLFENITHAQSVEDCKVILMTSNADACIVGPTLSLKSAKDILEVGKSFQKEGEDRCAFVAVYNETGDPEASLELAKADSLLRSPFKRHQLIESVVKGVVKANVNSPWRGIPLSTFGCNEVEQEDSVHSTGSLSDTVAQGSIFVIQQNNEVETAVDQNLLQEMSFDSLTGLQEINKGFNSGMYKLDRKGELSPETQIAIRLLARKQVEHLKNRKQAQQLVEILSRHLTIWATDMCASGETFANEQLRQRLFKRR